MGDIADLVVDVERQHWIGSSFTADTIVVRRISEEYRRLLAVGSPAIARSSTACCAPTTWSPAPGGYAKPAATPHSQRLERAVLPQPLTVREREIAGLAAQGLSSQRIAERLVLSVRTVDNHLHHVYAKLGVSSRMELVTVLTPREG